MNDLTSRGDCFIVQGMGGNEGILANTVPPNERATVTEPLDSLNVKTQHHIIFKEATTAQTIFQNAVESLAQELRKDELTDRLLALESRETVEEKEEHAAVLKASKEKKMKDMMKKLYSKIRILG
jgi:hypothetical protein